jgi:hypothetical protein
VAALKKGRLQEKIEALKQQMERLKAIETQMNASPDQQVSLTDPDARSMRNREGGIVGYNVQTAVDAQHHLIVAHEVTNEGGDRDQLAAMAQKAKEVLETSELTVVGRPRILQKRGDPGVHELRRYPVGTKIDDLEQPCRGSVRQAGLYLRGRG